LVCAAKDQEDAGYGEDDKERIVLFEEAGPYLVMVFMEVPQKPVHYKPVRKPGNAFHREERAEQYQYVIQNCHQAV
jgi:hypothetical protein